MRAIFDSISELLPMGLEADRFESQADRARILQLLDSLAGATGQLESHGQARGAGFRYLSLALARDIEEVRTRFKAGEYDEARYFLLGSIQDCIACHSRVPNKHRFELAEPWLDGVQMQKLTPHERAQLYVVTRRFDQALTTWEGLFADPQVSATEIDMSGVLLEYLLVGLRGEADEARVRKALGVLTNRIDLPLYLRSLLETWITSLDTLAKEKRGEPTLAAARALFDRARSKEEWPGDRRGMVFDLVASRILNQIVDSEGRIRATAEKGKLTRTELAEVYSLLGIIESQSLSGLWLDESSNHLEAAIRIDPAGPFARRAFLLLEENTLLGYGGGGIENLPVPVWENLEELRKLAFPEAPKS